MPTKPLIGSVPYLLQVKGFRHGAGGHLRSPDHIDSEDYNRGYMDGVNCRQDYIKKINRDLFVHATQP